MTALLAALILASLLAVATLPLLILIGGACLRQQEGSPRERRTDV